MNYPDNTDMSQVLDIKEPVFSHYEVLYYCEVVNAEKFETINGAFEFAKEYTKELALEDEMNFEKVTIEVVYDTDEDDNLIWGNTYFKTVEYNSQLNEWEVS